MGYEVTILIGKTQRFLEENGLKYFHVDFVFDCYQLDYRSRVHKLCVHPENLGEFVYLSEIVNCPVDELQLPHVTKDAYDKELQSYPLDVLEEALEQDVIDGYCINYPYPLAALDTIRVLKACGRADEFSFVLYGHKVIKEIQGNILDAKDCIVCQQVNHQGVMGGGLALQIVRKYPGILQPYRDFCKQYSFEEIRSRYLLHWYLPDDNPNSIVIANIFGQNNCGYNGCYTDYSALDHGFVAVKIFKENFYPDKHIAIPYKIGCGLAGGDWNMVSQIIDEVFPKNMDVRIYNYEKEWTK